MLYLITEASIFEEPGVVVPHVGNKEGIKFIGKNEKYEYWLDVAEYDLSAADSMFNSARYAYVAFMWNKV